MAEQHRHELIPAGKTAGVTLGAMLSSQMFKLRSRKDVENLSENTAYSVHRRGTSCTFSFVRSTVQAPATSRHLPGANLKKLIWTGVLMYFPAIQDSVGS